MPRGRPKSAFLSPKEARILLGVSESYVRKLLKEGRLHAVVDGKGVHHYSRAEILKFARRRHVVVGDIEADIAAKVFRYFQDGFDLVTIVTELDIHPTTVRELYAEYKRPLGTETPAQHAERIAREQSDHDRRQRRLEDELHESQTRARKQA